MKLYVKVERPLNDGRYWKVSLYGMIIALCPSMETATDVARALQFYAEHNPNSVIETMKGD